MEKIPYHKPLELDEDDILFIQDNIKNIIKTGRLSKINYWVKYLENDIKELYDVKYVIATSNCTLGLSLCFQYFNVGSIHMPNFTWNSPYLMFHDHHNIDFYDINKKTWLVENIPDYHHLIKFPTHTFGNIIEIKEEYHTIYDGAHALGSKIKKFGEATVLSLAPTKPITSGEGGIILTNNDFLAEFLYYRRDRCARMSEIHALIGHVYFQYLDIILNWKKMVYDYYKKNIPGQFQEIPITSNYNTIGFLNTEKLIIPEFIETKQYYEPIFQVDLLPNSYEVYKNIICLPSWYNCPYEIITESILEANNL